MNLIPDIPGTSPNYWCTWGIQCFSLTEVKDMASWTGPVRNLDEGLLFGIPGWATHFFDSLRGDLYILFDVGWDTSPNIDGEKERWKLGSVIPDKQRFPSCSGTPVERLRKLNNLCKQFGWRGAGLWIAPQVPGDGKEGKVTAARDAEAYWRERIHWSHLAGIEYWKVDVGHFATDAEYRRMLTNLARKVAPGLTIEHAPMAGPFNDVSTPWSNAPATNTGRFRSPDGVFQRAVDFITFSDVLRIYDVTGQLSVATSLDRTAQILAAGKTDAGVRGLVNCEDEPYLAAGLGCTTGIMRHPLWLERPDQNYDPAHFHRRIDETVLAVRWQRVAPAFGVNEASTFLDDQIATDRWLFHEGDCWAWWVTGKEIVQSAPARVARGTILPVVKAEEESPFVVASRHPNGATAVATLARTDTRKGFYFPLVDIEIDVADVSSPIGIFGRYRSLSLHLTTSLDTRRIWAQDLAADQAVDITDRAVIKDECIILSGNLIQEVGLSAATPGDLSEPGLILKIEERQ